MKLFFVTTTALFATISFNAVASAENLENIQQLLSTRECEQCDLQGAGLTMANLAGANLSRADLSRANLSRANLSGADLTGANLSGTSLNGANLTGANLSGAIFYGTDLRDAYLVEAKLYGTNLRNAYVQGAFGIPNYAGTPEDFYAWGVSEAQRGNHPVAIEFYNRTLSLKSDFAPALFARAISRLQLGDENGAILDAKIAGELFTQQDNAVGTQASENFVARIEAIQEASRSSGGSRLGNVVSAIGSLASMLLRFLL